MIPSGAAGAVLRIIAAYYIVYQLGLFVKLKDITENTLMSINALDGHATITEIARILEGGVRESIGYIEANFYLILTVMTAWIIGGFLLDSGMARIKDMLPKSINIALTAIEILAKLAVLTLFALIILYSFNLIEARGDTANLSEKTAFIFDNFSVFFLLVIIPLLMTPLRALLLLVYGGSARNRIGSIFILLSGLLYLYIVYLVYTLYNPMAVVGDHLESLLEAYQAGATPAVDAKEIITLMLETTVVALDRAEFIVENLMAANGLLLIGFMLLKHAKREASN